MSSTMFASLCCGLLISLSSLANDHKGLVVDIEQMPSWYGEKFDLIYDGTWVQFRKSKAYLDDDDLLFVGGDGTNKDDSPCGIRFATGDEWEKLASGRKIRISVTLKSATGSPLKYKIMYATNEAGSSGWKESSAGRDFETYSFDYNVPRLKEGKNDFVVLVPECSPDKNSGVLIKSAALEFLDTP